MTVDQWAQENKKHNSGIHRPVGTRKQETYEGKIKAQKKSIEIFTILILFINQWELCHRM